LNWHGSPGRQKTMPGARTVKGNRHETAGYLSGINEWLVSTDPFAHESKTDKCRTE
jgi:hypothetical protein